MDSVRTKKKSRAQELRKKGYSYLEIAEHKSVLVPRSTVVTWCQKIVMSKAGVARHAKVTADRLRIAQGTAASNRKAERFSRVEAATRKATGSGPYISTSSSKRAVLAALYLAEGTKGRRGGPTFGNSDPEIIRLYLLLLRDCFVLDETKFRCTVQARAGQDIASLEKFWLKVTGIPKSQFYKARVDTRGNGKLDRKPDYKGVCRIDYFSTDVLYEITAIGTMLTRGH